MTGATGSFPPTAPAAPQLNTMFDPNWNADAGRLERPTPRTRPRRRSPLRYLVPILMIAVIVGVLVIVHDGLGHHKSATTVSTSTVPALTRGQRKYANQLFYTVQPGDSISGISERTGVPAGRIVLMNHGIDPKLLQAGQHLRIHLHRKR